MTISDQISLAAKNLTRRPGRTALTVVGVVVGTCAVIVMISLGVAQSKSQEEMLAQWSDLTQIQVYGSGHKDGKELKRYQASGEIGEGHGSRAGVTYRLADGRMIYVPESGGEAGK